MGDRGDKLRDGLRFCVLAENDRELAIEIRQAVLVIGEVPAGPAAVPLSLRVRNGESWETR